MKRSKEHYTLLGILSIIIVIYMFFFMSQNLFGENIVNKRTHIKSTSTVGGSSVELIDWIMSKTNNNSEVILNIKNDNFDTVEYKFSAIDVKENEIDIETVYNKNNYIVLLLKNINKNYNAIALKVEEIKGNNVEMVKLYTNTSSVATINSDINKKTNNEYIIDRFNRELITLEEEKKAIKEDINKNDEKLNNITKVNEELSNLEFKTDKQKQEDENTIKNNREIITQFEKDNDNKNKAILEIDLQMDNIKLKIKELNQ